MYTFHTCMNISRYLYTYTNIQYLCLCMQTFIFIIHTSIHNIIIHIHILYI
jgi:hypothetical protein